MAKVEPTVTISSSFLISVALGSEIRIGAFRGQVVGYGMRMDNTGIEYTIAAKEMLDHYPPAQDICF